MRSDSLPPFLRVAPSLLCSLALVFSGCAKSRGMEDRAAEAPPAAAVAATPAASANPSALTLGTDTSNRRVIRTAELWLEASEPDVTQRKVAALAESKGGFVLSSDTSRTRTDDGAELTTVTVVFRVPSTLFDGTLESVRAFGTHVSNEKVTGQDVTEEYVDLEARIKAQHAVEDQYMAVLKDAKTIPDILAVQQKLGEARTEIERADGRRRFLENQTSLSTFTVHLARQIEAVEASGPGFGNSVKRACHDAVDVTIGIVNGFIRLLGVLTPIGLLIGLPLFVAVRFIVRRRRRLRAAAAAG
jgi:hypothetical protein